MLEIAGQEATYTEDLQDLSSLTSRALVSDVSQTVSISINYGRKIF